MSFDLTLLISLINCCLSVTKSSFRSWIWVIVYQPPNHHFAYEFIVNNSKLRENKFLVNYVIYTILFVRAFPLIIFKDYRIFAEIRILFKGF